MHELAFANHYDGKQLILPEEEQMLALPQVDRVQSVTELGGDLLEIESERVVNTGLILLSLCRYALVDLEALKVLLMIRNCCWHPGPSETSRPPRSDLCNNACSYF